MEPQTNTSRGVKVSLAAAEKTNAFSADPNPLSGIPSISDEWQDDPVIKGNDWLLLPMGPAAAVPLNGPDTRNPNPVVSLKRGGDDNNDVGAILRIGIWLGLEVMRGRMNGRWLQRVMRLIKLMMGKWYFEVYEINTGCFTAHRWRFRNARMLSSLLAKMALSDTSKNPWLVSSFSRSLLVFFHRRNFWL